MDKEREEGMVSIDFVLPEGRPSVRQFSRIGFEGMSKRIAELRAWFPEGMTSAKDRWQSKRHIEFTLDGEE